MFQVVKGWGGSQPPNPGKGCPFGGLGPLAALSIWKVGGRLAGDRHVYLEGGRGPPTRVHLEGSGPPVLVQMRPPCPFLEG